jgi:hypothetical protein
MFANGVLHERVPYLLLLFLVCCIILEDDAPALQPSVVTPGVAVGHDLAFEAFDIQLPPFVGFEVEVFLQTRVGARDTPRYSVKLPGVSSKICGSLENGL